MKTKNKNLIWIFLLGVFLPELVWGAPVIESISGTLGNGQSITVYGSGFGSKDQARPQLWDTVDNQVTYQALTDGDTIPSGGANPWPENQDGLFKMESTDPQRNSFGGEVYKGTGMGVKLNNKTIANSGKIYLAWWFKPSVDPNTATTGGHSSKFVRLSNSGDPVNKTFSWTQMNNYVYRTDEGYCQQSGGSYWDSWSGVANQWNFQEVYMDGRNRIYEISVNGNSLRNGVWNLCNTFDFDQVWSLGWDSGGTEPLSMTVWMDDIYLDNTPQRAMLCSGSSWSSRGNCENQIPSSWSDEGVTLTLNQGSFSLGGQAYLYVVDATGSANASGYPLTIGTTVSGTGSGLSSPTGLTVF